MNDARHRLHATVGALSILIIGVILGMTADRLLFRTPPPVVVAPAPEAEGAAMHAAVIGDLVDNLDLNDEQTASVHQILMRHQAAVDESWSAVRSRLQAAIDSVTTEIDALLDPERKERLRTWLRERHATSAGIHTVGREP